MNRFRRYFTDTFSKVKSQPIMFFSAFFAIGLGLVNMILSTVFLSIYIGFAAAYSLMLGIIKLHSLKQYQTIQEFDNKQAIKQVEWIVARRIATITAVMSFLHLSLAIVSIFFHEDLPRSYGALFILYFGGAAVIGLIVATVNVIRTRRNHSMIIHHLKLIVFAHVLILASLAQRIIFYHEGLASADIISGIGSIMFAVLAGLICLLMFKKIQRSRSVFNVTAQELVKNRFDDMDI